MKHKKIIAATTAIVLSFTLLMTNSSSDILRALAISPNVNSSISESAAIPHDAAVSEDENASDSATAPEAASLSDDATLSEAAAVSDNAAVSDSESALGDTSETEQISRITEDYDVLKATNQFHFSASELVPLSNVPEVVGYLTPQQFGAKGNGVDDDTLAFRKLFQVAYNNSFYNDGLAWAHAKAIYIPSGVYIISGPIIDYHSEMRFATFEVCGAGRESTQIRFTGNGVLFDDQVPESSKSELSANNYEYYKRPIFAFTTFRDIEFIGNQSNTFLKIRDAKKSDVPDASPDGPQRFQFISCGFRRWHGIIETVHSSCQLSEVTFSNCKIADCGEDNNPCRMFYLYCSQSVDWRFDNTDIESFKGDAFFYDEGASVCITNGSVIALSGNTFVFNFDDSQKTNRAGESCSPHLLCTGVHFEIKPGASLLKTTSILYGTPNAVFRSCKMGTASNCSSCYLNIYGGGDILFDNCYDVSQIGITGNLYDRGVNSKGETIYCGETLCPRLKFTNCSDLKLDYLTSHSNVKNAINDAQANNIEIIVDDTYDFYLKDNGDSRARYLHAVTGLHECRQPVNLWDNSIDNPESNKQHSFVYFTNNSKTIKTTTKPYGFVKYAEITTLKNTNITGQVTVTLREKTTGKQIGEVINLTFESSHTHVIVIDDFVEELEVEISHNQSTMPKIDMIMELVKY